MWREPLDQLGSAVVFAQQATDLGKLTDELSQAGWFVARCDCSTATDKATLINAIAGGLQFPEWTGRNWDALYDSLTDLDWISSDAIVLVLDGVNGFRKASAAGWQTARDLLVEAADWWQRHEKTLIVVLA